MNANCYSGLACTYPNCHHPKAHATKDCWTKEKEEHEKVKADKKKQKAKKAKKKVVKTDSNSDMSSGSDSEDEPSTKKHHQANQSKSKSENRLKVLKVTSHCVHSCHGKTPVDDVFIAHPDSGTSNHMTHKMDLFNPSSFKTLAKPIPISLGDDLEIFMTGKGHIRLMFNVDGKQKEGHFDNVLFVPDLKVTLLSVGQSARIPHCKVIFDNNVCEYINKQTNEEIVKAYTSNDGNLYTLDVTPKTKKVAANLISNPS